MLNYAEVLVANGTGILLMFLILHYGNNMFRVGLLADKLYYGMVWLTVALCMVETATFLIDGKLFARFADYGLCAQRAVVYHGYSVRLSVDTLCRYKGLFGK